MDLFFQTCFAMFFLAHSGIQFIVCVRSSLSGFLFGKAGYPWGSRGG